MRNEYYDDYEQAEAVKKWLKENGMAIFTGLALGLGGLFGWRYWDSYSAGQRVEAARAYQQLVGELAAGQEATAEALAAFRREHSNPAFVGLAALELSRQAIAERNLDEAMQLLQTASNEAEPSELRAVAGLRLARVQMQAGKVDEALATIERFDNAGFAALAAEIRGDVLIAKGDRDGARQAYQYALDNLKGGDRGLLQMKFDDLAPLEQVAVTPPADGAADETADGATDETTDDPTAMLPAASEPRSPSADEEGGS